MTPGRTITTTTLAVDPTYTSFVADLDGDGWDDILWYAPRTTQGRIWFGGRTVFTSVARPVSGSYRCRGRGLRLRRARRGVLARARGPTPDRRWDVEAAAP